ncbi:MULTISPECIES: FUSC family protein [unclassified Photobacterium]|uniref:FUSC family protein n=1 Tax=unclassified Photobacterium TaxID=2628852 RepID=UPI000D15A63E|nr:MULTISPECIES: FUSC family protein [unclassified Photobacterium]PSV27342.1 transporter [Photobacterium sp. GB-56]PSV32914.1 transporter [Photobacterium sp. GB-72]PSV34248.1 transporter [Photobacterium sp. GB-27]PSV41123.1 transporter [Photobacterium sp. GB-210]PSV47774.1 transporter [Photobacterium sp. GB-36]
MYLRFKNLLLTHAQFSHALRVTMAIAFSLVFYHFIPVPHSMWGPVTVAVVLMQPYAGVIKQKGFQRVGGTLLGAILGLVTVFFPQNLVAFIPIWILTWCFLLSLKSHGKNTYIFFLAVMTLIIVAYQGNSAQEVSVALWRVTNIIIGSLIAMSFSMLFPIRAKYSWDMLFNQNMHDLRQLYQAHASAHIPSIKILARIKNQVNERQIKMISLLANVQKENPKSTGHYKAIVTIQSSMISLIEQLIETHWSSDIGRRKLLEQTGLKNYQQQIVLILNQLADDKDLNIELPDIHQLKQMALQISQPKDSILLGPYGYLWLTRQLVYRLDELIVQLKLIKNTKPYHDDTNGE